MQIVLLGDMIIRVNQIGARVWSCDYPIISMQLFCIIFQLKKFRLLEISLLLKVPLMHIETYLWQQHEC